MTLGFIENKVDSNLFFKVEGGRPVMLLLYVDDLFLVEKSCRVQDEGLGYDVLLSRHGGVAECRWNLPGTREVCSRDPEVVRDDGL